MTSKHWQKRFIVILGLPWDHTLSLIITLNKEKPHKWDWYQMSTENLKVLGTWVISLICSSKSTLPSNIEL